MPEPTKTETELSPEEMMANLEPSGGLKNMLDMMLPEEEPVEEEKKKEEEPVDPPAEEENKSEEESSIPAELEKMKPEELVSEIKKNQTLLNDTTKKYTELETKYKELEAKQGSLTDEKLKTFLTEFRSDPSKAYQKYQKELELPDMNLFKGLVNNPNDNMLKLKHYQQTELIPLIEKKFNFDKGTFKFDADEAEDPETASALFRKMSRDREYELDSELKKAITLKTEQEQRAKEGQKEDLNWLRDNIYGGDQKKADEALQHLHSLPEKILKGEAPPTSHPFRLRTLLLGVNHETLVKQAVDKAVEETEEKLITAYAKEGLYLKNPAPEDLKTIKKAQAFKAGSKQDYTGNPAEDDMIKLLNN